MKISLRSFKNYANLAKTINALSLKVQLELVKKQHAGTPPQRTQGATIFAHCVVHSTYSEACPLNFNHTTKAFIKNCVAC